MVISDKKFLRFVFLFLITYLFFYYGALFITGLAVKGGLYSSIIEKYFNVAYWLRSSLILSTKWLVGLMGIETYRSDDYVLRVVNGRGIRIVYSCLGFAVMSFWIAYIIATIAKLNKKIKWLAAGLFIIYIMNVLRITMVLLAGYKGWKFPFGWDHHTWFNLVAYCAIFLLMYFFERDIKLKSRNGSKSF